MTPLAVGSPRALRGPRTKEAQMQYMLVIYGSEAAWSRLTPDEGEELGRRHKALQAELRSSGELIDHKELAVEGARVVRTRGGVAEVVDEPFTEGQELLSGYYLIDVRGAERATEIATRFGEA